MFFYYLIHVHPMNQMFLLVGEMRDVIVCASAVAKHQQRDGRIKDTFKLSLPSDSHEMSTHLQELPQQKHLHNKKRKKNV